MNISPFITPMRPPPAVSLVPIAVLPVELTQYRDWPVGALPSKWTRPVTRFILPVLVEYWANPIVVVFPTVVE